MDLEERVRMLEDEQKRIKDDVTEIKMASVRTEERLRTQGDKIDKIDKGVGTLLKLIAGGFISAAILWIIQGGFLNTIGGN